MKLIRVLIPTVSPKVPYIRGIGVIYKFIKQSTVPQVELIIDFQANILGASYEADTLQNNRMKNNRPPHVPFMVFYAVDLFREV